MEYVIIWIAIAVCAAVVAEKKNRSAVAWFFICIVLPIAIVTLLYLDKQEKNERKA